MNKGIELTSMWEDPDLFEVKIFGSNGLFSGQTECYTQRQKIEELGDLLANFQLRVGNSVSFNTFGSNDFSYFSFDIKCVDATGKLNIKTIIAHNVSISNAPDVNYKVDFDFDIDPASLDRFAEGVKLVAKSEIGTSSGKLMPKI